MLCLKAMMFLNMPLQIAVQIPSVSAINTSSNATNILPSIMSLPSGTILKGVVSDRNPRGHIVLNTINFLTQNYETKNTYPFNVAFCNN